MIGVLIVAHGELGASLQPTLPEIQEQLTPAHLALAMPFTDRHQFLGAIFGRAHQHQDEGVGELVGADARDR